MKRLSEAESHGLDQAYAENEVIRYVRRVLMKDFDRMEDRDRRRLRWVFRSVEPLRARELSMKLCWGARTEP